MGGVIHRPVRRSSTTAQPQTGVNGPLSQALGKLQREPMGITRINGVYVSPLLAAAQPELAQRLQQQHSQIATLGAGVAGTEGSPQAAVHPSEVPAPHGAGHAGAVGGGAHPAMAAGAGLPAAPSALIQPTFQQASAPAMAVGAGCAGAGAQPGASTDGAQQRQYPGAGGAGSGGPPVAPNAGDNPGDQHQQPPPHQQGPPAQPSGTGAGGGPPEPPGGGDGLTGSGVQGGPGGGPAAPGGGGSGGGGGDPSDPPPPPPGAEDDERDEKKKKKKSQRTLIPLTLTTVAGYPR